MNGAHFLKTDTKDGTWLGAFHRVFLLVTYRKISWGVSGFFVKSDGEKSCICNVCRVFAWR